jgi:hypothetical protein
MNFIEIGWGGTNWINLAQDKGNKRSGSIKYLEILQ